ncbi:DUF1501 domain-containing protein [Aquabacterium lacunae]|uniref:DUF1501 domain-containing protein n=1 Tax=Aquabacterium lacunae TaxID=2528630 RepID=A0A4Q9H5W5_9BURK|nr:DUF1501 domain-containing protein [Aquabacterium lacunae]TBO34340.1 DUF1501 domain-containing protein [Aquabacterium lacunae]
MTAFRPDRRQFLRNLAAAGIAGAAVQPWLQLQALAQTAQSSGSDYKALVCLFLHGGNDGNNLLVPIDPTRHALYAQARQGLTLNWNSEPAASQLLRLSPTNTSGTDYGLHGAMPLLKARFDAGQMAVLSNIGPLMEPTDKGQFEARSVELPSGLFSHSDQQAQWQTDSFSPNVKGGWGGRLMDTVLASSGSRDYACVSVTGSTLWGTNADATLLPFRVPASGRFGMEGYVPTGTGEARNPLSEAIDDLLAAGSTEVFGRVWLQAMRRSVDNQRFLAGALAGATLPTTFPQGELGQQLQMVARLISVRGQFGLNRQCFFCGIGGFDTHGEDQRDVQQAKFAEIDEAVDAFMKALTFLGLADKVTLFTASDFNRTLVSNGKGSDHAWGNHHLVVGGAVRGQQVLGRFPDHTRNGPDDLGGGVWVPDLAIDQLGGALGTWFGAGSRLSDVFPRIGRFDSQALASLMR